MIPLSELYSWLNREDNSHLSNKSKLSIWQINDSNVPDAQKDMIIEALVNSTRTGPDECEYAEVLVFAGKTKGERKKYSDAQYFLNHAIGRYAAMNELYRGAIAKLMLSNIQWMMGDNNIAYAAFRQAREVLEKITRDKRQALLDKNHRMPGLEKDVVWYAGIIDQVNDAWIEQPEEAYSWLNLFQESYLTPPVRQISDKISSKLAARDFVSAYLQLAKLQEVVRRSQETRERAEAYAFSGLSFYQMGNVKDAEKYLNQSAALFPPDRHHQTIARWMHALVTARDPNRLSEATRMCSECVRCFEGLRLDADHNNRPKECAWYEAQANSMRRVIKKLAERM